MIYVREEVVEMLLGGGRGDFGNLEGYMRNSVIAMVIVSDLASRKAARVVGESEASSHLDSV